MKIVTSKELSQAVKFGFTQLARVGTSKVRVSQQFAKATRFRLINNQPVEDPAGQLLVLELGAIVNANFTESVNAVLKDVSKSLVLAFLVRNEILLVKDLAVRFDLGHAAIELDLYQDEHGNPTAKLGDVLELADFDADTAEAWLTHQLEISPPAKVMTTWRRICRAKKIAHETYNLRFKNIVRDTWQHRWLTETMLRRVLPKLPADLSSLVDPSTADTVTQMAVEGHTLVAIYGDHESHQKLLTFAATE